MEICITNLGHKQLWWEDEPQPPLKRNSSIRKGLYKLFWTMLHHRQGWPAARCLYKSLQLWSKTEPELIMLEWWSATYTRHHASCYALNCSRLVSKPRFCGLYGSQMWVGVISHSNNQLSFYHSYQIA